MNRTAWTLGSLVAISLVVLVAFISDAAPRQPPSALERGEYLVMSGGCGDCHTPMKMGASGPEPDMKLMLAGHPAPLVMPPPPKLPEGPWMGIFSASMTAWSGPWGVSYSANITSDKETGIGQWTAQQFVDAIKTGRHLGKGRAILPPMPIPALKHLTEADLKAMFAYLQTVPAIANRVPEPVPPASAAPAGAHGKDAGPAPTKP